MAAAWPQRRWAVLVAQQLLAAGQTVLDVPAVLGARTRLLAGSRRNNDDIDSRADRADRRGLREGAREDFAQVMRLLIDRREQLTAQRTRTINRLRRHLADLVAGGAPRG